MRQYPPRRPIHHLSRRHVLGGAAGMAGAFALAACGDDGGGSDASDLSGNRVGAMDNYGPGVQFKATEPVTFSIMMMDNPGYPYNESWPFWSELTSRTNVTLDNEIVPIADYNEKRGVLISGGDAPMIIPKTYPPDEEQFVAGGAILAVSDYLDLMPNFQDKLSKWDMAADLDTRRQEDGKFYILPGLHEEVWLDYTLAVRTDILDELGLEAPATLDDFANMLREMKAAHPDVPYPFSDRWSDPPQPGANSLLGYLSEAFGTRAGWDYQAAYWNGSEFVLTGAMDEYRQMCEYLNSLVSEGLMDPESFSQLDDAATEKFASGQSFVISTNAQTLVNDYRADIANIPGATVAKIMRPLGPAGNVKRGSRLENGVLISSKARDSENFVAMMQFVDWLFYSDEGLMFTKWGIEGETYTGSVDDGTFQLAPDIDWAGLNPGAEKNLQVDYGFLNGVFAYGGTTNILNSQFPEEEQVFQEGMAARETLPVDPPKPLTAVEREQVSLWETAIRDKVDQETLKFILGDRPLSEWDAYVSELEGLNGTQLLETMNGAYQRFQEEHG